MLWCVKLFSCYNMPFSYDSEKACSNTAGKELILIIDTAQVILLLNGFGIDWSFCVGWVEIQAVSMLFIPYVLHRSTVLFEETIAWLDPVRKSKELWHFVKKRLKVTHRNVLSIEEICIVDNNVILRRICLNFLEILFAIFELIILLWRFSFVRNQ